MSILSYSEMKITLWGQRATAFTTDGVYSSSEAKPIVVLFVGGLMKSYQGMCSGTIVLATFLAPCQFSGFSPFVWRFYSLVFSILGNYYLSANTASRWYFNPSIPEARQFYARYVLTILLYNAKHF